MSQVSTRIYLVENKINGKKHLINAISAGQAVRFAANGAFTVKVPTTMEVADLAGSGIKVESCHVVAPQLSPIKK